MDHHEAAQEVARRLREALGDEVKRVVLYGSVARRQETSGSDVDLLIVVQDYRRAHRGLLPILGDLLARGAPVVSVTLLTTNQWSELAARNASFYQTIQAEGEVLAA